MPIKFTPEQVADYVDYERVRKTSRYNMFDPRARQSTGMTEDTYLFVIENFAALRAHHQQLEDQHILELAELHQPE